MLLVASLLLTQLRRPAADQPRRAEQLPQLLRASERDPFLFTFCFQDFCTIGILKTHDIDP